MPKVDPTLWRDIMAYLRQRHAAICRQWFEDLEPVELHSGLLKVHTSNTVQRNYLQRKCLDQFTEAAQATTGALVAVRFVTEDAVPIYEDELGTGTARLGELPPARPSPAPASGTNGTHGTPGIAAAHLTGLSTSAKADPGTPGRNPKSEISSTLTATTVTHMNHATAHGNPGLGSGGGAATATSQVATAPSAGIARALPGNGSSHAARHAGPSNGSAAAPTIVIPAPAHQRATPRVASRPVPQSQYLGGGDESAYDQIVISPDYSFENFVTGPNNQLACAASVAVANQPGTAYNPLFIHGGVGLGKTHLLQAICQTIIQKRPEQRLCYLSCDTFMNQFLDCVQSGKMNEFRHRYRHVDVLVIDDIHFLANRERTQEEFFHTFNALYQSNRQIILSSDSPPAEIPQLEERLVSRFQWGLVTHVSKPCYETRVAIIRAKAKLRGMAMPDDVVAYIAEKIDSNARELEGAINTIQGHSVLQNRAIDLALAQAAMGDSALQSSGAQVTLHNIVIAVTSYYNVKLSDLQSKRRHKSITGPRQVCMWLARKRTRFSLEEIGIYFGGRDHTTVMHSIKTVDEHMTREASFAAQIEKIAQHVSKIQGSPATAAATTGT